MTISAIIVGGGIGGLTAAVALRQQGIQATVIEQATQLMPLGAGLSIWTNAVRCLRQLGLADELQALGSVVTRVGIHRWDGRPQAEFPVAEVAARFGAPSLCALRSDLQQVLLHALPSDTVRLGCQVASFEQTPGKVQVTLEDGSTLAADLLVGADGLHSTVRQQRFDDGEARYQGYGGVLGVTPLELGPLGPPGTSLAYIGPGSRFGLMPCGADRAYWFFCANRREPLPGVTPADKQALLDRLRGWHPHAINAVRATPEKAMIELSFHDRPPLKHWSAGRITLLGDAAHPMTPILGQGACQAIEDGLALALALKKHAAQPDGVPSALAAYEQVRIPRTTRVVNTARRLGRVAQWEKPFIVAFRNTIATYCPRWLQERQMAWQFEPELGEPLPIETHSV